MSYLLLMVPLFGILPGDMKPVLRFVLACPRNRKYRFFKRIQLSEMITIQAVGDGQKCNQHLWTDALHRFDPIVIDQIEILYDILIGRDMGSRWVVKAISGDGEIPDIACK